MGPGGVSAHLSARARGPGPANLATRPTAHATRTRARGPNVCDRGHRITNTGHLVDTNTNTGTGHQAAARPPGRRPPGSSSGHRHQARGPGTRQQLGHQVGHQGAQQLPGITANAAVISRPITAAAAVISRTLIEKWRAAQSDGHRPTQRGPGRPAAAPAACDTRCTVDGSSGQARGPGLPLAMYF